MIKQAEQSPRIENGVIRWYYGDTFKLELELEFTNDNGDIVNIQPTDEISISFKNHRDTVIYENTFNTNTITLDMTEELSQKFKVGEYYYTVKLNSEYITTLMKNNKVVVE